MTRASENPLLDELQKVDPRNETIAQALDTSGARRSSLIVATIYVVGLALGAVVSAALISSITFTQILLSAESSVLILGMAGRFRTRMVPDLVGQLAKIPGSVLVGSVVGFFIFDLFDSAPIDIRSFVAMVLVLIAATLIADWSSIRLIRYLWANGHLRSRALLIGSGRLASELAVELRFRKEYGVDLVAVIDTPRESAFADQLVEVMASHSCDRLFVAPFEETTVDSAELLHGIRHAVGLGIPSFVVPRLHEMGMGLDSMSPDRARGYPLVRVQRSAHPAIARRIKRALDIAISSIVLIPAGPFMVIIAAAVKVTSPGPVLFRQPRVGQGGREFDMFKFRSMTVAENEHDERESQYRITSIGRILRATSIDELPQLINVLRGNMSLVGPRPERVSFVEEGLALYPGYEDRHRLPMGLTGLAQVAGLRGEETSVEERVKFDNLYIDQWSTALDLQIIAKTAAAVLLQTKYRRRERELEDALSQVPAGTPLEALVGHEEAT